MKFHQLLFSGTIALIAGGGGYFLGESRNRASSSEPVEAVSLLECPRSTQSFSEVENAKGLVEELASRYINELRIRRAVVYVNSSLASASGLLAFGPEASEAITDLEQGMEQFAGTDQYLLLVHELLWVLRKERLYERWLQVYLDTLYEHPTHELVGRSAGEALLIAKSIGREQDLIDGFKHLSGIPLEFDSKRLVEAALLRLDTGGQFVGHDRDRSL